MGRPKKEIEKVEQKSVVMDLIEGNVAPKREKWKVQVIFDGSLEQDIKAAAAKKHVSIATYIKLLVHADLEKNE